MSYTTDMWNGIDDACADTIGRARWKTEGAVPDIEQFVATRPMGKVNCNKRLK
jgi:hypothetical protein